jgi:hypothetical protein
MNSSPSVLPHDPYDDVFETGGLDGAPEERQGVHAPGGRVDDLAVMMLPAGLVLLRPAVVVDGEQHRAADARRRAEIHGRLSAVGADLEERSDGTTGHPDRVQREAFVVGHESLRGARDVQHVRVDAHPGVRSPGAHDDGRRPRPSRS